MRDRKGMNDADFYFLPLFFHVTTNIPAVLVIFSSLAEYFLFYDSLTASSISLLFYGEQRILP